MPHALIKCSSKKNHFPIFTDVNVDWVVRSPKLSSLNVDENPLTREAEEKLSNFVSQDTQISFTRREIEEWENLDI